MKDFLCTWPRYGVFTVALCAGFIGYMLGAFTWHLAERNDQQNEREDDSSGGSSPPYAGQ